jgi:arsenite methyltransferase
MTEAPPAGVDADATREQVRERYGKIAAGGGCCASSGTDGGCGSSEGCCSAAPSSAGLGYSDRDLATLPTGADLGLGCGNPTSIAELRAGEVVLDLGSGAGIDCFLAATRVGPSGRVIGVDMTPAMVSRARQLARSSGPANLEFWLGEIEHLPVADGSVDVILSNCVVNLVPDKVQVYREAFRVLRPGGRLAIADVLATRAIPDELRNAPEEWAGCSSGALTAEEVTERLRSVGFGSVEVRLRRPDRTADSLQAQSEIGVVPGEVRATKPGGTGS